MRTAASTPLRVALLNDYEIVVRGLARMFDAYHDRIQLVELDAQVPLSQPVDIVLYDTFGLSRAEGDPIAETLHHATVGTLMVYGWEHDSRLVERTSARGAIGFVSKGLTAAQLVVVLEAAHARRGLVAPTVETAHERQDAGDWPGRVEGLTPREAEVVAMITQGLTNAQIAEQSYISINSVKSYIRTAYRKMRVSSRSQAVLWGVSHGFRPDILRDTHPRTR